MTEKAKQASIGFSDNVNTPKGANNKARKKQNTVQENIALELMRSGKLKDSEKIYRYLIREGITNPSIYFNLGEICKRVGKIDDAIINYRKGIELKPDIPDTYYRLALLLQQQGEQAAAVTNYKAAVNLKNDFLEAHAKLGLAFAKLHDSNAAIDSYKKALAIESNSPEVLYNMGNAYISQGNIEAAIEAYKQSFKLNPNNSAVCSNLGNALWEQGDLNAAATWLKNAIEICPDNPHPYNTLGIIYGELGNNDAAITSLNKALRLKPNFVMAHSNLGFALMNKGDLKAATDSLQKALKLNPRHTNALYGFGIIYNEQGNHNDAVTWLNKALMIQPDHSQAHNLLSLVYLLLEDYQKGWAEYEYRAKYRNSSAKPHAMPKSKKWDGHPLKQGEKLLIVSEQGLGDTLQFMRYILFLKKQGVNICFCAQTKLHGLIQASGIEQSPLNSKQANVISNMNWIPLLSLPKHLGVTPTNPIINEPYIASTDELVAKWKSLLSAETSPIIGINWQGNAKAEKTSHKGRSLPLETFSTIIEKIPASIISLQKGFGSEQLESCSFRDRFVSCQELINETYDFLETAAIIVNCDLIITSDTCVAHLAGGLNKPTWLLLKAVPDWRWGLNSKSTFWYPSMRLFRQNESGNWPEVMHQVAIELKQLF